MSKQNKLTKNDIIKRERESTKIKKARMIEALTKALGIVSAACPIAGITRNTHYAWVKEDPEYKEKVEDISDIELDFVESKLHQLISSGDTTATIFYLKTKGKRRGYAENIKLEVQETESIEVILSRIDELDNKIAPVED